MLLVTHPPTPHSHRTQNTMWYEITILIVILIQAHNHSMAEAETQTGSVKAAVNGSKWW